MNLCVWMFDLQYEHEGHLNLYSCLRKLASQIIQIGCKKGVGLVGWLPKLSIGASLQLLSAKVGLSLADHWAQFELQFRFFF